MTFVATKVGINARGAIRSAALAADRAAVLTTPVDTGRARGNWIATIGSPSLETFEAGQRTQTEALAQAEATLKNWTNGTIFIANSVPYIIPLEYGWSRQAPNGMVTSAYDAARAELAKARLLRL